MKPRSFKGFSVSEISAAYYLHAFFFGYGQATLFIFGALFILQATASISLTLSAFLAEGLVLLFLRTLARKAFLLPLKILGSKRMAVLGIALEALAAFIIAFMPLEAPVLIMAFCIKGIGSVYYYTNFHAALFSDIGKTKISGTHSAHIIALHSMASLASAGITMVLALYGFFYVGIFLACISFVIAAFSMRFIRFPPVMSHELKLSHIIKSVSPWCHLANISPEATMERVGLPIVMYGLFTQNTVVLLVAAIPLIQVIFSYLSGFSKDGNKRKTLGAFSFVSVCSWLGYLFVQTPSQFVPLNATVNISNKAIAGVRDAKTADEVVLGNYLAATLGFEASRAIGMT